MSKKTPVAILLAVWGFFLSASANAEDWTVNGKTLHNVIVGNFYPDRVEITFDGGVGTPLLKDLPPELQKRFNYDPDAAKAAAQKREVDQKTAVAAYAQIEAQNQQLQAVTNQIEAIDNLFSDWGSATDKLAQSAKGRADITAIVAGERQRMAQLKDIINQPPVSNYTLEQKKRIIIAVRNRTVFVGMGRDFVLLSKGQPSNINAAGTVEQLVFGSIYTGMQYISVENGAVTAFRTDPPTAVYESGSQYSRGYNADLGQ